MSVPDFVRLNLSAQIIAEMPALMSLQTCNRCRKRRTKCDLRLPACGNCEQADVECFFHDDSLQQEIPRSYLFALQKKVQELESEIKDLTDAKEASSADHEFGDQGSVDLGYCITSLSGVVDFESTTVYVGPGSTAHFMDRLLRGIVEWHIANKSLTSAFTISPLLSLSTAIDEDHGPTFSLALDGRRYESFPPMPLSTQRSLIEHYLKVIQSKYPLLSRQQESQFLDRENPMKWSMTHNTHPDSLAFTAIFAISMALVARDLDSNFSGAATSFRRSLKQILEEGESSINHSVEASKQNITLLCFSAILELVNPISGDIWQIVGRAVAGIEQLRADLHAEPAMIDDDFRRLELSLLKIESSLALHFRRPSPLCEMRRASDSGGSLPLSAVNPPAIYDHLLRIAQGFAATIRPSQDHFENLIPSELKVLPGDLHVSPASATLYLALHPLFTSSLSQIFSTDALNESSLDLLRIVADSASTIIDGFVQLDKDHKIISIWRSAERVLEAGAVWATYVIKLRLMAKSGARSQIRESSTMSPLLKCNTLLTSFSQRWKVGSIYAQIWETFLLLIWGILE